MIRSMTGYGEAERATPDGRLRAEIKTVNHRFFNLSLRMPPGLDRSESEMRRWLRPLITRGHVQVSITFEKNETEDVEKEPLLDLDRARAYAGLLRTLREEAGLAGEVDMTSVLRFGDVIRVRDTAEEAAPIDPSHLREVTETAARAAVVMRETEGERLRADMAQRLKVLGAELDKVEAAAPERLLRERDRLREAVRELAGQEEIDEDRLSREIAYLAEKWDIHEEIVRFRSHLELFEETLGGDGAGAVGKRLTFVVQEMHREANTIGAKANDVSIGRAAVAMKEEIERLREQVENVE